MLSGPLKIGVYLDLFLLSFFYCLKLPCMKIYKLAFLQIKHPCLTRGLGPLRPSSRRLQSPGPGLQRLWRWNISMLDLLASKVSMKSCDRWGQAEEPSSEADRAVGQSWQEPTALGSIHIRGNLELLTQWDVMKQCAERTGDGKPGQRFCAPETLSIRARRAGSLRHVIQPGQEPRWWLSWGVWEQRMEGTSWFKASFSVSTHTFFFWLSAQQPTVLWVDWAQLSDFHDLMWLLSGAVAPGWSHLKVEPGQHPRWSTHADSNWCWWLAGSPVWAVDGKSPQVAFYLA